MSILGLDIGGANLKLADGQGFALSVAFPLWKQAEQLAPALKGMLAQAPAAEAVAITMTGELADCFATKAAGVTAILDAVTQAAGDRAVSVYLCDGRLVTLATARAEPLLAAASNWHVLATFASRYCAGATGLLIDIGSTTCDIIPLGPSSPATASRTDPERLVAGELVYTGVERSPLCAVVTHLPWRGSPCPVAQELFATTADAYTLLGDLPEELDNKETADGRPRTKAAAHARIARAICADATMLPMEDAVLAAEHVAKAQLQLLTQALRQVMQGMDAVPKTIVLSGHGEFLSRRLLKRVELSSEVVSLSDKIGGDASRAACAHALAVLATERASI